MSVLLMPMEEKEGELASADAWAWAVPDGVPVDMIRDENGMFVCLVANLLDARWEARSADDGLGGMTRVLWFCRAAPMCMYNIGWMEG